MTLRYHRASARQHALLGLCGAAIDLRPEGVLILEQARRDPAGRWHSPPDLFVVVLPKVLIVQLSSNAIAERCGFHGLGEFQENLNVDAGRELKV